MLQLSSIFLIYNSAASLIHDFSQLTSDCSTKLHLKLRQLLSWCLDASGISALRIVLSLQKYQLVVFYRFYCSDIAAWSIAREPESMAEWKWYILSQFSISTSRKLPACILKATNNKKFAEKENFQTKEIL